MITKQSICVVAVNDFICQGIKSQLIHYIGKYVDVNTWCLNLNPKFYSSFESSTYLLSGQAVFDQVKDLLPGNSKVIIAKRTLEINSLDELLGLPSGTEALVISSHEITSNEKIVLLSSLGLKKLRLIPYWQGRLNYPKHVKIAITTGDHPVPPGITKVVNIGIRTLDISTFVEIIVQLNIPLELINTVSNNYISALINMAAKRLEAAEQTKKLNQRLHAILDNVKEPIIAVDQNNNIEFINPAFQTIIQTSSDLVIGSKASDFIPELDFTKIVQDGEKVINKIQIIRNECYIINTTPIIDKPNNISGVLCILKPVDEVKELDSKVRRELNRKGHVAKHTFGNIIGESKELKYVNYLAQRYAKTDVNILIESASGTGKELLAQSIHNYSQRHNAPFVAANFASISDNLVESELFGYEEGAFTGAKKGGRHGLFEDAHTGTIFLDEIGDASLDVQKRLLRVIEEKEIRRVGSNTITSIDVRVIAATHHDLKKMVSEGKFREDLYYRLCTIKLVIPPLKERKEDILVLIDYFAKTMYKRELMLDNSLKDLLYNYDWPGNIRELQNLVKLLCGIVEPTEKAYINHLPSYLQSSYSNQPSIESNEKLQNSKLETILFEFKRIDAVDQLYWVLTELKNFQIFGRGLGRPLLVERLKDRSLPCPDHKVRLWLNLLQKTGCISTGSTKQGSKLTSQGESLLDYLTK